MARPGGRAGAGASVARGGERGGRGRGDPPATRAAEGRVVVAPPGAGGDLVRGRPADVGRGHQPQLDKEGQRPIDRRAVDGREVGVDALIQLGHGHVPAQGAQGIEDDLALGGQARAAVVEGGSEVEGGVGHSELVAIAN